MLTADEIKFIEYWQEKRKQNKLNPSFFGKGFSIGLSIGLLITLCFTIGWNKQAPVNILNSIIVAIAFVCIAIFCAWFYNNFKYEQYEQQYKELLVKKKKYETSTAK